MLLESVLVADRGLGAARVLVTCQRLGIKSVLVGLSEDDDEVPTDAAHLADDLVLLAGVDELTDPGAVVRAALAAGVQAIHPGYGPLRGDLRLARAAADAGLVAVVTTGVGPAEQNRQALVQSRPAVPTADPGASVARWVFVLGAPQGAVVLGSVRVVADRLIAAAPDETPDDTASDHRIAHAAAAVLGVTGLVAVGIGVQGVGVGLNGDGAQGVGVNGVGADGVVAVVAGLPETHAAWELATDVDLVEQQLLAATGESPLSARSDFPVSGAAIGRPQVDAVDDIRSLDDVAGAGLRVDAVAVAGSSHGALVRVSAWGEDLAEAERVLARYVERR